MTSRFGLCLWTLLASFVGPPPIGTAPPADSPPPAEEQAQAPPLVAAPATRADQIALERRQKHATLWPERQSPLVVKANRLMDRGLVEGIESGQGNNGWQLLFSGTRANQGQTFGLGYRRSDLFRDALTARATLRGTLQGAYLVDGELQINRLNRSAGTFVNIYGVYERSPRMEFYGLGAASSEADRTGYLLNTGIVDVRTGYRFTHALNAGFDVGYGTAHTGPVTRSDIPSIETEFNSTTAPGLFDDARFTWVGAFAGLDTRDLPRGPKRGGFYGIDYQGFLDLAGGTYSHRRLELEGQHFFPYFNEQRVLAVFVKARFAYAGSNSTVPFYLMPKLGGNFELRGFGPYRFYDNNAFVAALEHRWYTFSGLEMAAFMDAGKTVPTKGRVNFDGLNYSGGIGLRARLRGAIVLRFDVAKSREGYRYIWSMSDISRRRF